MGKDKKKMIKLGDNCSRRKALLFLGRVLAALGLTSLGIKLASPGKNKVLLNAKSDCKGCRFEKGTCIPQTQTCRRNEEQK